MSDVVAKNGLMRHLLAIATMSRPFMFMGSFMATYSVPLSSGSNWKGIIVYVRRISGRTACRTSMGMVIS
jgi:hypothetical protein